MSPMTRPIALPVAQGIVPRRQEPDVIGVERAAVAELLTSLCVGSPKNSRASVRHAVSVCNSPQPVKPRGTFPTLDDFFDRRLPHAADFQM
jgi:hypothetical protein